MKQTIRLFLLLTIFANLFYSCSTDVDLFADYKDITVVYGLLDVNKDTNYVKINKAFLGPGNALDIALIADSCNYPTKLNSRIIEYVASNNSNNYTQTRVLELDTITIHDKEPGIFYSPNQLVYFTKEKIHNNTDRHKYRYDLEIDRGDTLLTASTHIVGGGYFAVVQSILNFSSLSTQGVISWYPCPNSAIYDVEVDFHYYEIGSSADSVLHVVRIPLGTHPETELAFEDGIYSIVYNHSLFLNAIADEIGADSLLNVERVVFEPCMKIKISAGGDELYNFISVNGPTNSIVQTIPEYTNVTGGYGVFSSRTTIEKKVRLSSQTFVDLRNRENWHFRQGR
ncbi:MAG: hypothetical protein IKT08_06700 [Bacteroidales bacterium]|nr:hypothetical protein [Bacteroidales bacterium]